MQSLKECTGKHIHSSPWKWEMNWGEVSAIWENRREVGNGDKMACFLGPVVPLGYFPKDSLQASPET